MLTTKNIKNVKEVAEQSGRGVKLYYNIKDNSVSTKQTYGTDWDKVWFVTEFLRKNTEEEIVNAVNRLLSM